MTKRTPKSVAFGLLASTAIASPAFAQTQPVEDTTQSPAPGTNATDVTGETPQQQTARDGEVRDSTEIIITAQKREENLQDVPISVQAIGTRRLDQLNISNFEDYTKQLPSVSFQTAAPGFTTVYMRGVASGGDGNHTGSLPSVGFYLDEQRSRPSVERSTFTSTTSPESRASPVPRALSTARRARPARSASSPTSPSSA